VASPKQYRGSFQNRLYALIPPGSDRERAFGRSHPLGRILPASRSPSLDAVHRRERSNSRGVSGTALKSLRLSVSLSCKLERMAREPVAYAPTFRW
jgi:hypothetical protein